MTIYYRSIIHANFSSLVHDWDCVTFFWAQYCWDEHATAQVGPHRQRMTYEVTPAPGPGLTEGASKAHRSKGSKCVGRVRQRPGDGDRPGGYAAHPNVQQMQAREQRSAPQSGSMEREPLGPIRMSPHRCQRGKSAPSVPKDTKDTPG